VFLSLLNFEHAEFLSLLYFARAGLAHVNGFDLAATAATSIMVFLIVRIEGIEGTAKPLIGLLTLLGLPRLVCLPMDALWDIVLVLTYSV